MAAGTGTLTITRVAMSMRLMLSVFDLEGIVQEARTINCERRGNRGQSTAQFNTV